MIVPSIDLLGGQAVQLVGGVKKVLDAGDPRPIADRFGLVGEVATIDLDAALGQGSNKELLVELLSRARCRVGGGIRDLESARFWLDAGAAKIIIGTAAQAEFLKQLPKERVIAALDAVQGEVVVEGWTRKTGHSVLDRMEELKPYVGGFLVTFVEREGRLEGVDMARVRELVEAAGDAKVTVAGGVRSREELAEIDRMGADAQVGMALYKDHLDLADAFLAPVRSDRADGLWPTVIVDSSGAALGLAYSNRASIRKAIESKRGVYYSRSKMELWTKGESSGATQELLAMDLDCDRDAIRFTVRQADPGFCHTKNWSCWQRDWSLGALWRTLNERKTEAPEGSYTKRLFEDADLLAAKLKEEAAELAGAGSPEEVCHEAADLIYFALTTMAKAGVSIEDVENELKARALKVTRRPGDAKSPEASADD